MAEAGNRKQQSLDEWRNLTSSTSAPPRAFLKGDQVRFYFRSPEGIEAFKANWNRVRVPTSGFKAKSALLHWDQRLSRIPEHDRGWREATVIEGAEWRALSTNLIGELTPKIPGHGAYYQAFLADRLLYRDGNGAARTAPAGELHREITIEHQFSVYETLEVAARRVEAHLAATHPGENLFVVMAPNTTRFTQPMLVDRLRRRCIFLTPAALYDSTDTGFSLSFTVRGLVALLPESHGIALIKNPISSATRLADLAVETVIRFVRLPLPKPHSEPPPVAHPPGMDLADWEAWLDRFTGTRCRTGSLRLLIDGDRFFPRFHEALTQATNQIDVEAYIFDRDDIAVKIADELKQRSQQVGVRVVLDQMGSIGAGSVPPGTPMPENFAPPASISSYLRDDSNVHVRPFLNPWFSSDHSKVFLVDHSRAWVGGMNLGREYRYEWHDLMVELEGPIVNSLEWEFQRQWAHAGPYGDLGYLAAVLKGEPPARDTGNQYSTRIRLLPTRTAWKPFSAAVQSSIRYAKNHIYVENPYLFDKRVILALVRARNRGVDVRVVLPRVNDLKAGGRGNLVIANYFLEHGVRVYFYPGMTHVKALLVDGWVCLGSGNLNHLSLRVNQEENLATSDPAFAAQVRTALFEDDFARSSELTEPISVDWVDVVADLLLEGF
jgi:phosphatidylserine/phosphatidylglycerophosphate/cardiolipin synthase-like enzyme